MKRSQLIYIVSNNTQRTLKQILPWGWNICRQLIFNVSPTIFIIFVSLFFCVESWKFLMKANEEKNMKQNETKDNKISKVCYFLIQLLSILFFSNWRPKHSHFVSLNKHSKIIFFGPDYFRRSSFFIIIYSFWKNQNEI